MLYIVEHIAFYALLASPVWVPLYLFVVFIKGVEAFKPKPPPKVATPVEMVARRLEAKATVARFAAMRAKTQG
jgi:hypothetical protein